MDRRTFIGTAGLTLLASESLASLISSLDDDDRFGDIRAIAFDAFPIFDPRPVFRTLDEVVPDRGPEIRREYFQKIFAYTWLRSLGGRYVPFDRVLVEALDASAESAGVTLTRGARSAIVKKFSELDVWPDVRDTLDRLAGRGIRLVFLSNMTEAMLRSNAERNGIAGVFESFLSTDRAQIYKPHPKAYQIAPEALGLGNAQICFAAFASWDAYGAGWFGFPTVWVNRLGAAPERLGDQRVISGDHLGVLEGALGD